MLKERDEQIKYLTDNKLELERFISETRSVAANDDLNNSGNCLDYSFLPNSVASNESNSFSTPENLGACVVDVKLREKEVENKRLEDDLKYVSYELKCLATRLTKLTEEFDLPIERISTESLVDSATAAEQKFYEEDFINAKICCQEQFHILNSCVEKIDTFWKTQNTKMKLLEEQTSCLQKDKENLIENLTDFKKEVFELKEKFSVKEKLQHELEKAKQALELLFKKLQYDMFDIKEEKDNIYCKVISLQEDKEKLSESIQQLKTKLILLEKESKELCTDNKNLKDNELNLLARLQEVDKVFSDKSTKWEEDVKHLNTKLTEQSEDIELYRQTEKTMRSNIEQMVVQNERLEKEERLANSHLSEGKKDSKEKQDQLSLLGHRIANLKQKNELLETKISTLNAENKELFESNCAKPDLTEHLVKLKDHSTKMELLTDSKQHECELKKIQCKKVKTEIIKVLNLFTHSKVTDRSDDIFNILQDLKVHIEEVINTKSDLESLQDDLKTNLSKSERLNEELKEKHQAEKFASEQKIAELQHQFSILKKLKSDGNEEEQELHKCLENNSLEYESTLKKMVSELKSQQERCANKEMELILIKSESTEARKNLKEAEKEIQSLCNEKQQLQKNCEDLKQFESRVIECSEENNKLRQEIETYKDQVTQNGLRLSEADKALEEFIELIKEQNSNKAVAKELQNKVKEKENYVQEMGFKLQQQTLVEEQFNLLKQNLDRQNVTSVLEEQKENLDRNKLLLSAEVEQRKKQTSKEEHDKFIYLTSLKKSSDQWKTAIEETVHQKAHSEEIIRYLTEQLNFLTYQSTKLQGDLVAREAELRLVLNELKEEKDAFQKKLTQQLEELSKKSDLIENTDMILMTIVELMEKHFNLDQDFEQNDEINIFNYQKTKPTNHIQKLRKHLNNILRKQQILNEKLNEKSIISATSRDSNNDLVAKLNQQEEYLKEFHEQLQSEKMIIEKKMFKEVKRLEEDLLSLEKVNDRLANENVKIQINLDNVEQELKDSKVKIQLLENELVQWKNDIRSKSLIAENMQQRDEELQNSLEKSQQLEKPLDTCKFLDIELNDKNFRLRNLEKQYHVIKEKAEKNEDKLALYQQIFTNQKTEHKKLQDELKMLQASNDFLESDLVNKIKEYLATETKTFKVLQQHEYQDQQNMLISQKSDNMTINKVNAESKCQQFESKKHQLEGNLDPIEVQRQVPQQENIVLREGYTEKLQLENKNLKDKQEVYSKRIEKLALKLGESQARSAKGERDNEKLRRTLEAHTSALKVLQREKIILQSEAKSLKERLSRAERSYDQFFFKVKNLELINNSLQQSKEKLEASEVDCKSKINKLEKIRELNEEKLHKLTNSLTSAENSNVKLTLEIGALNCQLQAIKSDNDIEHTQNFKRLNHELAEAKELQNKYEEINDKLKFELSTLKEENSSLNDKLSKASLSLDITSKKCERFSAEIEQICAEILVMRQEKSQIEHQHETFIKNISKSVLQNAIIVNENENLKSLKQAIADLEAELALKSRKFCDLVNEIKNHKTNSEDENYATQENTFANLKELKDLRTKISLAEDLHLKDQQIISQLRLDNQILHTKYQESKQRALDVSKTSEERIKDNRLELEGKLEKMKNKMVSYFYYFAVFYGIVKYYGFYFCN